MKQNNAVNVKDEKKTHKKQKKKQDFIKWENKHKNVMKIFF